MKGWLRRITDRITGRRPEPAPLPVEPWHAEDFAPVVEAPRVSDPWAPEASETRSAKAPGALPLHKEPPTDRDRLSTGEPSASAVPPRQQQLGAEAFGEAGETWSPEDFLAVAPELDGKPAVDSTGSACSELDTVPPGVDLPDFDPDACQVLRSTHFAPLPSRARTKAEALAALLDIPDRRALRAAVDWLEELFLAHPHSATYRALEAIARASPDLSTLQAVVELRALWAQTPAWWVHRTLRRPRYGSRNRIRVEFEPLPDGPTALSWNLAYRICLARAAYPVEEMIDPDWLYAWYRLPPVPGSPVSFVDYLEQLLEDEPHAILRAGLTARARAGVLDEPCDRHDWARGLRDPRDGTPLGLRMEEVVGPPMRTEPTHE